MYVASTEKQNEIIEIIKSVNPSIHVENLKEFINVTNSVKGCKFVMIRGYKSDLSENTEIADNKCNVGYHYDTMIETEKEKLAQFDTEYKKLGKKSPMYQNFVKYAEEQSFEGYLNSFKPAEIIDGFNICLAKKIAPTVNKNGELRAKPENNLLSFNSVFGFNTSTQNLLINAKLEDKIVVEQGEFKKSNIGLETITKNLIVKSLELPILKVRVYKLGNMETIKIMGDTFEC